MTDERKKLPHDRSLPMPPIRQHHRNRHQHRPRPCGNPPAIPTGVAFTVQATEALNHLRFTGKLKWNAVTADEQGHGLNIKRYDTQMIACNAAGTPVENEDSFPRARQPIKVDLTKFGITDVTLVSGTLYEWTLDRNHTFQVSDTLTVVGMKPTGYNGTWTVTNVPGNRKVRMDVGSNPGARNTFGKLYETFSAHLHVIYEHLPRPKTWYWKARVRAIDKNDCAGDWSPWTTPLLPWTGSDPKPPVPTFTDPGSITFSRLNRDKHVKLRLHFTFNDMSPWDVPGGDHEDDLSHYGVQLDRSDDGIIWDGRPYRHQHVPAQFHNSADADDLNATRTAIFGQIRRRYWYRCRVRSWDRFGRPGDWSAWTTPALPFDDTQPPQPLSVRIFAGAAGVATDRIVLDWTAPTVNIPTRGTCSGTSGSPNVTGTGTKFTVEVDVGQVVSLDGVTYKTKTVTDDTHLVLTTNLSTSPSAKLLYLVEPDPDVAFYRVQLATSLQVTTGSPDVYNDFYATEDVGRHTRKAFKIPDADKGNTFYGRVRSVDAAHNRSKFIDGTAAGNSSPTVGGTGAVIGAGGGIVVATFTKPGLLRVRHYPYKWINTTGTRLTFKKARATVGDRDAGTGFPTGSAIKINLRRWPDPTAVTNDPVFQVGGGGADDDRLRIDANTYRDVNGPSTFDITYLDPEEALTVKVPQVGSTYPGTDLVVQVFMSP